MKPIPMMSPEEPLLNGSNLQESPTKDEVLSTEEVLEIIKWEYDPNLSVYENEDRMIIADLDYRHEQFLKKAAAQKK